jgi:hypothetical protein
MPPTGENHMPRASVTKVTTYCDEEPLVINIVSQKLLISLLLCMWAWIQAWEHNISVMYYTYLLITVG